MNIAIEQETDGRWIADIPDLPGAMCYGRSRAEAIANVKALAFRVLADRIEQGSPTPELAGLFEALP